MGVYKEHFVVYGIKSDYYAFGTYVEDEYPSYLVSVESDKDKLRYDGYNAFVEPKFICLSDNMCGEYSFFGICVFAFGKEEFSGCRDANFSLSEKDIKNLDNLFRAECIKQKIGINEFEDAIGLHSIIHYT